MLRDDLFKEVCGDLTYIKKIENWIESNKCNLEDFHTNLHDIEVSNDQVYIYSCLYDDLNPDRLSIGEFKSLLLNWIELSKA